MPFKDPETKKEYNKQYLKVYRQTDAGIKSRRKSIWRSRGVVSDDFDALYEKYINTTNCEKCNIELVDGIYGFNKRCLDHDHNTGEFRFILCCRCNNLYR